MKLIGVLSGEKVDLQIGLIALKNVYKESDVEKWSNKPELMWKSAHWMVLNTYSEAVLPDWVNFIQTLVISFQKLNTISLFRNSSK